MAILAVVRVKSAAAADSRVVRGSQPEAGTACKSKPGNNMRTQKKQGKEKKAVPNGTGV